MAINSSTLLFKFNNFYDTTKDKICPDQVSDKEGKWKDAVVNQINGFMSQATPAIDKDGIEWRITLQIHYFHMRDGGVNPDISSHELELQLSRKLAGNNFTVQQAASRRSGW